MMVFLLEEHKKMPIFATCFSWY